MSYVIACSNIKGGTAKTSTVSSLAGIFARQNYRVLAIDCDPQSNLTIGLGFNPDKLEKTLVEALSNNEMPLSEVILNVPEGFSLVPARWPSKKPPRSLKGWGWNARPFQTRSGRVARISASCGSIMGIGSNLDS